MKRLLLRFLITLWLRFYYSLRQRLVYYVGLRYLKSRFTSYVAILGVTVGVMVLVVTLSVMGGFQKEYWERLRSVAGDLTLESYRYFGVYDYEELLDELEKTPGIRAAAPYIQTIVLTESTGLDWGFLKGIVLEKESQLGKFQSFLLSPRETYLKLYGLEKVPDQKDFQKAFERLKKLAFSLGVSLPSQEKLSEEYPKEWPSHPALENAFYAYWNLKDLAAFLKKQPDEISFQTKSGLPGIIVGFVYFRNFGLKIGSVVTLSTVSSEALDNMEGLTRSNLKTREQEFEVVGTIKVGIYSQDRRAFYADLQDVQKFIGVENRVSGINLQCEDFQKVDWFKFFLTKKVQEWGREGELFVRTWKEKNKSLYQAVQMEKGLLTILLFFIVMVAGFMIFAILSMMVVEKIKDVGILKALGSPSESVFLIFLFQGAFIGVIGICLGLSLGLLLTYHINEVANFIHYLTGYHPFPPKVYYLDKIPVAVDFYTISFLSLLTFLVSFAFALYPAFRASRFHPIQALRYE